VAALATGPFVTISHVRGKANAGGLGFMAASDIVLAQEEAQFSLSELLSDSIRPACCPSSFAASVFRKLITSR
jgi:3-carboxymethyl-3-hydroxy-acyl-[acp] dehydratase